MDRKITISRMLKLVSLVTWLGLSTSALASFVIVGENETTLGDHGIAEVDDYKRAVYGEVQQEDEDKQFMSGLTPIKNKDYWFLKAKVAPWGNAQIESLEVKKIDVPPTLKYKSLAANGRPKAYVASMAGGYSWGDFALELEGFFPKLVSYRINPLTPAVTQGLDVRVQSASVFLNVEYSFLNFQGVDALAQVVGFHPYLNLGAGMSFNSAQSKLYNAAGQVTNRTTTKYKSLAGNIGAGLRWNFAESWSWDLSYRYAKVGKHKVGPIGGFTVDSSSMISRGYYFGIMYQI